MTTETKVGPKEKEINRIKMKIKNARKQKDGFDGSLTDF